MPMEQIENHDKIQFLDTIHMKAQQIRSRLKPYVQLIKTQGEEAAYDGLGTVEAVEISGRLNRVVFADMEHTRRRLPRRRFAVAIPVDNIDVRDIMRDPKSEYATAIVRAIERVFDRVAIEASLADVKTGKDFSTTVTATNDGVTSVNASDMGLVYDHLNELRTNFINNDVGTDMPEAFFLAMTGDEIRALLADYRVVSYDSNGRVYNQEGNTGWTDALTYDGSDYVNTVANPLTNSNFTDKMGRVENGMLTNVCGFNVVPFAANAPNPILETYSSGDDLYRSCVAASTRGIVIGIHNDLEVDVQKRSDYIEVDQIVATITLGGVRTEGVLVQELKTPWSDS
jgi:hypothetical protein